MLEVLSRWQFAFTVAFHYLFVPVTIGLAILVAIFETAYYRSRLPLYKSLSNYWSDIFIVSYVVGIVTGFIMPVQFGTNWSKYSVFMGDVFGSPLAFEALLAFFLESTFAGIWIFKRDVLRPGLRLATMWLIVLGTSISAVWILTANAFMQNPQGYMLAQDGSKVILTNFGQVLGNPYVFWMFMHNHAAALLLGAFIVLGISAWYMKRGVMLTGFRKSARVAVIVAAVTSPSLPLLGTFYGKFLASVQPLKAAAILNRIKIGADGIPVDTAASASLKLDVAALPGLPNMGLVRGAYLTMLILGSIFIAYTLLVLFKRKLLERNSLVQTMAMWMIPAAFVAITCGWIVAEAGRVPWLVYGLMTIAQGISTVPVASVLFSLVLLIVLYALLFAIALYLIVKIIRKGPQEDRHASA